MQSVPVGASLMGLLKCKQIAYALSNLNICALVSTQKYIEGREKKKEKNRGLILLV